MRYTGKKYTLTEDGKSVFGTDGRSFTVVYETPRAVVLISDKGGRLTVPCRIFVLMFREVKSRGKNSEQDSEA